eukprot:10965124-Alexandrium_andersonii.AAC.1
MIAPSRLLAAASTMKPYASRVRRPAVQAMWPRTAMHPPAPSCRMDTSPRPVRKDSAAWHRSGRCRSGGRRRSQRARCARATGDSASP